MPCFKMLWHPGHQLLPPTVQLFAPPTADTGSVCALSTVYNDPRVDVWYSIDGTIPRRGLSRRWDGAPFSLPPGVQVVKAKAYFRDAVASDVAAMDVGTSTV